MKSTFRSEQFDDWNQAIVSTFCDMGFRFPQDGFVGGAIAVNNLMNTQLSTVYTNMELKVIRNRSHISNLSEAVYLIKFQLQGRAIVKHRNHVTELDPGDFVICSTIEPYELELERHNRQAVLVVPENTMKEVFTDANNFLGLRMDRKRVPHNILSNMIQGIVDQNHEIPPQLLQRMEANVLDLLGTSLYAEANRIYETVRNPKEIQLDEIKRIINLNLDNPNLSVEFIANQSRISTRYLHMLFKLEGISVSRYILQQRLTACANALSHPDFKNSSTTDIALHWCFSDASHFNRCFKASYGQTPRQYRLNHT